MLLPLLSSLLVNHKKTSHLSFEKNAGGRSGIPGDHVFIMTLGLGMLIYRIGSEEDLIYDEGDVVVDSTHT